MKQQIIYQDLSLIHPYEKNPRKNDGAVAAVAESIQEFGCAVAVSGTGQGETPQSLVTPAFAGLSTIAESSTKAALTT